MFVAEVRSISKRIQSWEDACQNSVLCIALCQGAARHFTIGRTGIHYFDVYTFYRQNPKKPWYAKRMKNYEFGDAKFEQSKNHPEFIGRRVDCLRRGISVNEVESVTDPLRRDLQERPTDKAKHSSLNQRRLPARQAICSRSMRWTGE